LRAYLEEVGEGPVGVWRRAGGEAEAVEDRPGGIGVLNGGEHAQPAAAPGACQHVQLEGASSPPTTDSCDEISRRAHSRFPGRLRIARLVLPDLGRPWQGLSVGRRAVNVQIQPVAETLHEGRGSTTLTACFMMARAETVRMRTNRTLPFRGLAFLNCPT